MFIADVLEKPEVIVGRMPVKILTIGNIPQKVYSIPFKDYPEEGFHGATPSDLLEKILIGPTESSYVLYDAFVNQLQSMGIEDAESRVIVTGVPLKT